MKFIRDFFECLLGLVVIVFNVWLLVTLRVSQGDTTVFASYFAVSLTVLAFLSSGVFLVYDAVKRNWRNKK